MRVPTRAHTLYASLLNPILCTFTHVTDRIYKVVTFFCRCLHLVYCFFVKPLGSDTKVRPKRETVLWSLLDFFLFLALGGIAIRYPVPGLRIAVLATGATLSVVLLLKVIFDFAMGSMVSLFKTLDAR